MGTWVTFRHVSSVPHFARRTRRLRFPIPKVIAYKWQVARVASGKCTLCIFLSSENAATWQPQRLNKTRIGPKERKNGIVLESVDWRDKDDVADACKMLTVDEKDFQSRNKVKDFLRRYADTPGFKVNAYIEGARLVKGFRASMYMLAEEFNAFSEPDVTPIRYDENIKPSALRMSLLFESKQRAMQFSTKLRNWKFSHPMLGSSLEEIQVDDLPARVPLRGDLSPIKLNDYDPKEADDSPCTSLADLRGMSSVLPTEPISLTEPRSKYQSIEKEDVFALRNPYKLHIKD